MMKEMDLEYQFYNFIKDKNENLKLQLGIRWNICNNDLGMGLAN